MVMSGVSGESNSEPRSVVLSRFSPAHQRCSSPLGTPVVREKTSAVLQYGVSTSRPGISGIRVGI